MVLEVDGAAVTPWCDDDSGAKRTSDCRRFVSTPRTNLNLQAHDKPHHLPRSTHSLILIDIRLQATANLLPLLENPASTSYNPHTTSQHVDRREKTPDARLQAHANRPTSRRLCLSNRR